MPKDPKEDITIRLTVAALDAAAFDPAEIEALMREAVTTIELLRVMVGIREEIELEDIEPEGNA